MKYDYILFLVFSALVLFILFPNQNIHDQKVFDNPGDPINILYFVIPIFIGTFFILLFLKYFKKKLFNGFLVYDCVLIFSIITLVFNSFFGIILSFLLIIIRIFFKKLIPLIALILFPIISILFGISLSSRILLILCTVLLIYDFISVFKTKHMIKMAKGILESDTLMILKFSERKIGAGDYIFSLMILANFLNYFGPICFLFTLFFQIISFLFMDWIIEKYSIPLPALVFIIPFSYLAFDIYFLLFSFF